MNVPDSTIHKFASEEDLYEVLGKEDDQSSDDASAEPSLEPQHNMILFV